MNDMKKTTPMIFVAALLAAFAAIAEKPDSLKVLMIGNSFSISVTRHMPQIAKSMGLELDLASLYIGGCSMESHWKNFQREKTDPDFKPYKLTRFVDGVKTEDCKSNVGAMLATQKWDVVTVQQASHFSWQPDTFRPFGDDLVEKCIKVLSPQAEVVVQETWSYTPWDSRLANWKIDQNKMYHDLHRTYNEYAALHGARVIPTGTAVQLWRERLPVKYTENSFGGDVCGSAKFAQGPDGRWMPKGDVFHLNARGEYFQALVWTAKLFDVDVTKCEYSPKGLDPKIAAKMREVAMAAVRGEQPGVSYGGTPVPDSVAQGIARIRSACPKDCELRELYMRDEALRVAFVLRPSPISFIRCELYLPATNSWSGRFIGRGNGGWGGIVRCPWSGGDSASASTDMGTSLYPTSMNPIDPEIRRDFGWRSTHLMTVVAKSFVKAYYGRTPHHSYFVGASTGGGQGFCEAQRFPEDYDGILAGVPAMDRISLATPGWQRAMLKKRHGKWFSDKEKKIVREAELDFFAKTDPVEAHGFYIVNPRPTPEKLDACWKAIVAREPKLADREALWRGLFKPVYVKGSRVAPGQLLGIEFDGASDFLLMKIIGNKNYEDVTEDDMQRFIDDKDFNTRSVDLSAFAKRGGKIVSYVGLEDTSVPPIPVLEYYNRVGEACGGSKALRDFFAMYVFPGATHHPSRGGAAGSPRNLEQKLIDWVEKGEKLGPITLNMQAGPKKTLEIEPY